jgi:uncharacterized membrane protein YobD (UPF0266 family)
MHKISLPMWTAVNLLSISCSLLSRVRSDRFLFSVWGFFNAPHWEENSQSDEINTLPGNVFVMDTPMKRT